MSKSFAPGDRTYHVSDERLRAFRALTAEQKLRWVEELARFLRLAQMSRKAPPQAAAQASPSNHTDSADL